MQRNYSKNADLQHFKSHPACIKPLTSKQTYLRLFLFSDPDQVDSKTLTLLLTLWLTSANQELEGKLRKSIDKNLIWNSLTVLQYCVHFWSAFCECDFLGDEFCISSGAVLVRLKYNRYDCKLSWQPQPLICAGKWFKMMVDSAGMWGCNVLPAVPHWLKHFHLSHSFYVYYVSFFPPKSTPLSRIFHCGSSENFLFFGLDSTWRNGRDANREQLVEAHIILI